MREELRAFLARAADYTLTPLPAMLRLATRAPGLGEPPSTRRVYRLAGPVPNQLTDARHRVIEALREFGGAPVTLGELAEAAGCGASVVKGLVKLGVVAEEDAPRDTPYPRLRAERGAAAGGRSGCGGGCAGGRGGAGRLFGDAAERRDRIGQDRGLSGGGGGMSAVSGGRRWCCCRRLR